MLTINNKDSQLVNTKYSLGKSAFSASNWVKYKQWIKQKKKQQALQEKVKKTSKKRKAKKKVDTKQMSYSEQLKDERWLKKRKEVLDTKGYVCAKCGSRYNLQVHHLEYESKKMAWEYPMSNFVVLCEKCHKRIHNL